MDAAIIAERNIGKIIHDEEIEATVDCVANLTASDVETWTAHMQSIPKSVFAYSTEVAELKSTIERILEY